MDFTIETIGGIILIIIFGGPPAMWYVDRWLDATRAHVVDISKTAEAEK